MIRGFLPLFLRQFAVTLAALALLLQAAIPSGFMLAASQTGFPLSVVICGDAGRTVDSADLGVVHDEGPADQEDSGALCAFAGVHAGAVAPSAAPVHSAPMAYVTAELAPASARAAAGIGPNAPPPSRAPPFAV